VSVVNNIHNIHHTTPILELHHHTLHLITHAPHHDFFKHKIDCSNHFPKHKNYSEFFNGEQLTTNQDVWTMCKLVNSHKTLISTRITFLFLISCFDIKGITWLQMSINVSFDIQKWWIHLLLSYFKSD
jgi:hypothetical protein